jgi:hypothetical protein
MQLQISDLHQSLSIHKKMLMEKRTGDHQASQQEEHYYLQLERVTKERDEAQAS